MANSTPIYKAYVGIIPTAKGFGKSLEGELANTNLSSAASRAGDGAGRTLGQRMTDGFKRTFKVAGIVTTAIGAIAVGGGISRQLNIEDATKKLEGLGHTAEGTTAIMNDALNSVKGTAFGLDSAATQAAGAVAAGVKPGKELENYLRLTADAATIAGVSMDEMGFVMNKVQTSQVAYTEDLNMLADRGIPIFQWLQEEYGVTAVELRKMVADGKVDAETYFKVIEENIGGAALKSGETTRGAFKNMMASMSRTGVALTSGLFPLIRETFVGITSIFDAIGPKLEETFAPVWEVVAPMFSSAISGMSGGLTNWISNLDTSAITNFLLEVVGGIKAFGAAWVANDGDITSSGFPGFMERVAYIARGMFEELRGGIIAFGAAWQANDGDITSSGFPGFMERVAYIARQLFDTFRNADYSSFQEFTESLAGVDMSGFFTAVQGAGAGAGEALMQIAEASPTILAEGLQLLGAALQFVANNMDIIGPMIPFIVAGIISWKTANQAAATAQAAATLAQVKALPVQITANLTDVAAARAKKSLALAESQNTVAKNVGTASTIRATIAERAKTVATKIGTIATRAAAVATRLFGAALRFAMGPVGWIITGIALLVGALVWFFTQTELGKEIWAKVWGAIKTAAQAVADWFVGTVVPLLVQAWDWIKGAALGVADWFMGTLVPWLKSAWDAIAAGAVWLYQNIIKPVWEGIKIAIALVIAIILTIIDGLVWYWRNVVAPGAMWLYNSVIVPVWNGIKTAISVVVAAVMTYVQLWVAFFQNVVAPLFIWLWQNVLVPVWNGIKTAIAAVVNWFQNTALPFIRATITMIQIRFEQFKLGLAIIWKFIQFYVIQPVVNWFQNTVLPAFRTVIAFIQARFEDFKRGLGIIWNFIKTNVINPVVTWFQGTVQPAFQRVLAFIKARFEEFKTGLKIIWDFVKNNIINPVVTWFENTIAPKIKTVTDNIKNSFDTMKDGIQKAWDAVKTAAKAPVEFVINKVYNEGLKTNFNNVAEKMGIDTRLPNMSLPSGFRKGGILPGFSRMRDGDDQLVPMRRGEGVLVSEALRDTKDKALFLAANAAGRSGVGFSSWLERVAGHQGYKGGGIVDWLKDTGGDAIDWVQDKGGFLADALLDPKGALTKLVDTLTDAIPGAGMARDFAVQAPKKIIGELADKLVSSFASVGGGAAGPVGPIPAGASRSLSYARRVASAFGLTMTSFRRGGARTAGSGLVSLHALGRAMDFSNSSGPTPQMMGFFNAMHPLRPTELLYSPAGGRQWRRSGRQADTSGATKRMHYNHVHVGFAKGGIFDPMWNAMPRLMDTGGYLMPGVNHILNKTGGYETVIPRKESALLRAMSEQWDGKAGAMSGPTYIYSPNQVDMDETVERRTRREFETFVDLAERASK